MSDTDRPARRSAGAVASSAVVLAVLAGAGWIAYRDLRPPQDAPPKPVQVAAQMPEAAPAMVPQPDTPPPPMPQAKMSMAGAVETGPSFAAPATGGDAGTAAVPAAKATAGAAPRTAAANTGADTGVGTSVRTSVSRGADPAPKTAAAAEAVPTPAPAAKAVPVPAPQQLASAEPGPVPTVVPTPVPTPAPRTPSDADAAPAPAPAGAQAAKTTETGAKDAPAAAQQRPQFDVVVVDPHGSAVLAGRAAPGADVTVLDNGKPVATGRADASGQFVILPDKALPSGGQQLALQSTDQTGAVVAGDTPAVVVVPGRQAAGAAKATDTNPSTLAVLLPPSAPPKLLIPNAPGGKPPRQVSVLVADYDANGQLELAGLGRPGSFIRLYVDNQAAGEATVDPQGRWQLTVADTVAPGAHQLRADNLGSDGHVLSRAELPFMRAAFAPGSAHDEGMRIVQPRDTLWGIARHVYGHGIRYTVIFEANRDQIRDPDRIYIGQVFALPAATPPATALPAAVGPGAAR